ncbi:flagellar filament capping protein FliD [Saccharibacillus sacchari]|uniref:flagellar filament capping protein FliD n=1 Tax=Saccharibacillus sacchari TaxID=456493 RepID=UPI0004B1C9FC|nr:flagellar filament capping protein FliD [Saccharibacillus sacchari]
MVTRISGMASGMDIDSLVKSLMTARQGPLNKLNQQKQTLEWQRDDYRKMSTKLVTFMQDSITKLSQSSTINAQKATVTGNTSAVTATASSTASGTMTIDVKELATSASVLTDKLKWTSTTAGKLAMSDLKDGDGDPLFTSGGKVTIGNAQIEFKPTDTIESFVAQINSNKDAGVTAVYSSSSGLSLTSKTVGSQSILTSATAAKQGVTDAQAAVKSAQEEVDKNSDPTAKAAAEKKLADAKIDLETVQKVIGIDEKIQEAFGLKIDATGSKGTDSEVIVNGLSVTNSSNTFEVSGVSLTLNAKSVGSPTTITVAKDTEKVVKAVQDFVNAYNDVLSSVNSKVGEERYKKYTPLSSDQKKEMTDDEIKLWEDKAKSGMLKNDPILQRTVSDMRSALIQGVDIGRTVIEDGKTVNKPLTMTELGITTGTYDTKGKLVLDADKLTKALNDNPDIVNQFFGQNYSKATLNNNYAADDGILAKMRKISTTSLASLAEKAGTSKVSSDLTSTFLTTSLMGQRLTSIDREITNWNSRLTRIETNYYKQFTAMETAMNKYNTTMSSLSSM